MKLLVDVNELKVKPPETSGWKTPLEHDAAYAHALVMAMANIEKSVGPVVQLAMRTARDAANELMAEWGYTED